jgi:hypothetical protein
MPIKRPVVKVKAAARQNLIRHFNDLPVREELRFWINIEVDSLLELVSYWEKRPPIPEGKWNAKAQKSVKQFGGLARKLHKHCVSLPQEAWRALFNKGPELGYSALGLQAAFYKRLAEVADEVARHTPKNSKGGRPKELITPIAEYVADRIAEDFELLTGRRATAGTSSRIEEHRNDFERLLGKVYANLGIEASAEVQAKKLPERRKGDRKLHSGEKS